MDAWSYSIPAEIIVCDTEGLILDMNATAIRFYEKEGGSALIGTNVFSHHSEPSRSQVQELTNRKEKVVYTTEKNGQKTLVTIFPWERNREYAGFVLLTLNLPLSIPIIKKD
jgi:sensor histidine kinase regulating citrate/malate metabolism